MSYVAYKMMKSQIQSENKGELTLGYSSDG